MRSRRRRCAKFYYPLHLITSSNRFRQEPGIARSMFRELCISDPDREKIYPIEFFRCCEIVLITCVPLAGVARPLF